MEDILASIRRILSEDEQPASAPTPTEPTPAVPAPAVPMPAPAETVAAPAPPAPPPEPPSPPAKPAEDVLLLDASMLVEPPPAPSPPPAPQEAPPAEQPAEPFPTTGLLAPAAAAAAASSVGELVRRLSAERGAAVHRGGPTIEDVVREEVRPLLKAWLDAHLPALVERAVRAEIERVVGRAMG